MSLDLGSWISDFDLTQISLNLDYSIKSKLATIVGYFSIISLNNSAKFKAYIPKIKLTHPEILN